MSFPTGPTLVDLICEISTQERAQQLITAYGIDIQNKMVVEEVLEFTAALRESGRTTIDEFLRDRMDYSTIGRRAIAHSLLRMEYKHRLFGEPPDEPNWYRYLYRQMSTTWDDLRKNKLRVITFNYDRSLEAFLFHAITRSYNRGPSDVAAVLEEISVVHLYGQLGPLPWQDRMRGRDFHDEFISNPAALDIAAEGIRIVHDDIGIDTDPSLRRAHEYMAWAERIHFLGFGYDQLNLDRLRLGDLEGKKQISGTCLGFTPLEVKRICERAPRLDPGNMHAMRIVEFFRNVNPLD